MGTTKETKDIGWIQCSQCGNGFEVHRSEVEAGDYVDRQACDECGIGPMHIDFDYPDGIGWVAEKLCIYRYDKLSQTTMTKSFTLATHPDMMNA